MDHLAPLLGLGFTSSPQILHFFFESFTQLKCHETVLADELN